MSLLSDVHVTFDGVLDDFAITRFQFFNGDIWHAHNKKKNKFDDGAPSMKRTPKVCTDEHIPFYSKRSTDGFNEFLHSQETVIDGLNEISSSVNNVQNQEIDRDNLTTKTNEYEIEGDSTVNSCDFREKERGYSTCRCLLSPVCKSDIPSEIEKGNSTKNDKIATVDVDTGINIDTHETSTVDLDSPNNAMYEYDSDGDLQLRRKRCNSSSESEEEQNSCLYITIKHKLATQLDAVGEQVWLGAILLCDYICYQSSRFKGQCVVDLGAGTGLTSIVAAMFADHVYCTDTGENVLHLASCNIDNAMEYFKLHQPLCPVNIRELNWLTYLSEYKCTLPASQFTLTSEDLGVIKESEVLIAADVFYDDDITDAFFCTIKELMCEPPEKTLYIGLEKRMVFTIADLAVSCPAYIKFKDHLNKLVEHKSTSPVEFIVNQLDTDFPQFFQYDRTNYMELWTIRSTLKNT